MKCDEREEQLLLFALGETDGPEQEEFRAHMQGCPRCQGRLAEIQGVLAMLPMGLPPVAPPAAGRRRVMKNVAAQGRSQSTLGGNVGGPIARSGAGFSGWLWPALIGGALAASVTILIYSMALSSLRKSLDTISEKVLLQDTEIRGLRYQLLITQNKPRLNNNPSLLFAMLKGQDSQAQGHLIWDPTRRAFSFCATSLKTLPAGRAYQLWLINSENKPIPAATFTVDSHGIGMVECDLSQDPGVVKKGAVTEEPANGSASPTMPVLLSGQVE